MVGPGRVQIDVEEMEDTSKVELPHYGEETLSVTILTEMMWNSDYYHCFIHNGKISIQIWSTYKLIPSSFF